MAIEKDYCIEKSNILNEMKSNNMNLTEIRFFTIYLSKINARDISTRQVSFPISDFKRIMELQKVNISSIQEITNSLLSKIVNVPDENGGYYAFQLFKQCRVYKDKNSDWFVEIDAHDMALPLMFEFKKNYFKYELWNALRLTSANQIRMYEILKQYEKKGERTISVSDLKEYLGIDKNTYPRFGDFKEWVIEKAQKTLAEKTDISFEYSLLKKGAKVVSIRFVIKKNENYVDQLTLYEFISNQQDDEIEIDYNECDEEPKGKDFSFFVEAFNNEFSIEQVKEIYQMSLPLVDSQSNHENFDIKMYDYMLLKFRQLNTKKDVKHRYGYLKKLIDLDVQKVL